MVCSLPVNASVSGEVVALDSLLLVSGPVVPYIFIYSFVRNGPAMPF